MAIINFIRTWESSNRLRFLEADMEITCNFSGKDWRAYFDAIYRRAEGKKIRNNLLQSE